VNDDVHKMLMQNRKSGMTTESSVRREGKGERHFTVMDCDDNGN